MMRLQESGPRTRRLLFERLEDRAAPSDALAGLVPPFLGVSPLPDPLALEAESIEILSGPAARSLSLSGLTTTFTSPSRSNKTRFAVPDDQPVGAIPLVANARGGPALLTTDLGKSGDGSVSVNNDLALFRNLAASPFLGARPAVPFGGSVAIPDSALVTSGAAGGVGGTPRLTKLPFAASAPARNNLQTPEELAQIAHYSAQHAEYEKSHPHGHESQEGRDHGGDSDDAVHMAQAVTAVQSTSLLEVNSSTMGQWAPLQNWGVTAVHAHTLPTGKVMLWAYSDNPRRIWDPATDSFETAIPAGPGYNIFCVGHAFMADGRLFVSGGHVEYGEGLAHASIYDPYSNTWTRVPDMNAGRWYPTSTTLGNGKILNLSGSLDVNYTRNLLPQLYQPSNNTWRNLTTAELILPLYPFMFQAPNGSVFFAGPSKGSRYLSTSGTGTWTNLDDNNFGYRDYGTAVMYAPGKVLMVGGGNPPTATAEVIDLNVSTPIWRAVAPMATARRQLNATLLPDGKVLVTGGSSAAGFSNPEGAALSAELWDPATETWTTLNSATRYRGYHSTAVLLPDGRVLTAGGDGQPNAEVFSPPYLFKGPRPEVTTAPTQVRYGYTFSVETPDAANISKVNLIRLSSVTHAFDQNQRLVPLTFKTVPGGLTITPPASGNRAPPGDYLLFLVNRDGVPSVGKLVRMSAEVGAPRTPSGLAATVASPSQVNLTWRDTSNNETSFKLERRTGLIGNFVPIATVGANVTSYQDKNLTKATQYFYRIRATNTYGDSGYSNQVSATTRT